MIKYNGKVVRCLIAVDKVVTKLFLITDRAEEWKKKFAEETVFIIDDPTSFDFQKLLHDKWLCWVLDGNTWVSRNRIKMEFTESGAELTVINDFESRLLEGSGTKTDPYLLKNRADVCEIQRVTGLYLREDIQDYRRDQVVYFRVTDDIDMEGESFYSQGAKGITGYSGLINAVISGQSCVLRNISGFYDYLENSVIESLGLEFVADRKTFNGITGFNAKVNDININLAGETFFTHWSKYSEESDVYFNGGVP